MTFVIPKNYKFIQVDINMDYLNAKLNEDIFIKAPKRHPLYNKVFNKECAISEIKLSKM